jgi:hypothetical protein
MLEQLAYRAWFAREARDLRVAGAARHAAPEDALLCRCGVRGRSAVTLTISPSSREIRRVRRRWPMLVAGGALGLIIVPVACTVLFPLDGYNLKKGAGGGGSPPADAPPADAPPDDGPPDCYNGADACIYKVGAAICGQSMQYGWNARGVKDCFYTCNDGGVPCAKWCSIGCDLEVTDAADHCANEANTTCP